MLWLPFVLNVVGHFLSGKKFKHVFCVNYLTPLNLISAPSCLYFDFLSSYQAMVLMMVVLDKLKHA